MARINTAALLAAGTLVVAGTSFADPPDTGTDSEEDRRSSVVQRPPVPRPERADGGGGGRDGGGGHHGNAARFPEDIRRIDGERNNRDHREWGAAGINFIRSAPADYADGAHAPAGPTRPSARTVSNAVHGQVTSLPNARGLSDYLWQWGQFLDHDLDETPIAVPLEPLDIPVPDGDPWFDPQGTGAVEIGLDRSAFTTRNGVRQQLNNITAYIDASNVYGSEHDRAEALRTMDGTGRLKTSAGDLLPFNTDGLDNAPSADDPSFFVAGDIRANEQIGLTAMHTLFVREHNRQASRIASENRSLSGDEIYEHARAVVAGQMQAITYNEFLPALLGPDAIPPYNGYRDDVDASISNVFATAAYRVGHTMLSSTILRRDRHGDPDPADIALADAFFGPSELIEHGIDGMLRGLAFQRAQTIDRHIVDDVRNFLFGPPGAGGFDLASLNIQRGRDHGLASYNALRTAFGRSPADTFADVNPDPSVQAALSSVYASPDDIDAWTGLLSEPHRPHAVVGETLYRILRDQFIRLRDGDRFWYEAYLPDDMVEDVERATLARIIRRNTGIGNEIRDDVFRVTCGGDVNFDGSVDAADLSAVVGEFGATDFGGPADCNGDRTVNAADLSVLMSNFGRCE